LKTFLGIDVGSLSTKMALLDADRELIDHIYIPTRGQPVRALQQGLEQLQQRLPEDIDILGVATTGSARYLAGAVVGADCVKNEITSQATAALHFMPGVQTVIEIGGQDSKIIIIRDGAVVDFGMNSVCAAGTGSFLDHQAQRLNVSIQQFSCMAAKSSAPVNISGKCTVFAESDMIHHQQAGHRIEDIAYGLCRTLADNYLSNVAPARDVNPPIVFQGGVAFNQGIMRAFREELGTDIIVPDHPEITGAIGAALLAEEEVAAEASSFKGFAISRQQYTTSSFECRECPRLCQIARLLLDGQMVYSWGGGCDLFQQALKT
jgi:predicted CoA-substrate-specific enzyme activase